MTRQGARQHRQARPTPASPPRPAAGRDRAGTRRHRRPHHRRPSFTPRPAVERAREGPFQRRARPSLPPVPRFNFFIHHAPPFAPPLPSPRSPLSLPSFALPRSESRARTLAFAFFFLVFPLFSPLLPLLPLSSRFDVLSTSSGVSASRRSPRRPAHASAVQQPDRSTPEERGNRSARLFGCMVGSSPEPRWGRRRHRGARERAELCAVWCGSKARCVTAGRNRAAKVRVRRAGEREER